MKTASFKKYRDRNHSLGVSIVQHNTWAGPVYPELFPDPFISQHKFERGYRKKLETLDPQAVGRALAGCVLLSDNFKQRKILGEWLGCEEL